jgi:hypothetical protein
MVHVHADQLEGGDQAQPAHLLLALLNMTPLPTVLHNPVTWVIDKSTKRHEVPYMVLSKVGLHWQSVS